MSTPRGNLLGVTATLIESMGSIQRYQVQVELTITVESIGDAISAVAEALNDLVG